MKRGNGQAWLHSPFTDGTFILLPAFLAVALVLIFPSVFQNGSETSPLAWLLLVVFVDVAHVYSTLFRTYLDRAEFQKYRRPLLLIPLLAFPAGVALYLVDGMVFWRVLAYLAVYHFVRQQYGFFSIYARKEQRPIWERRLDAAAIYLATLYPLVHWHCHLPRNFHWFVVGDFVALDWPWLEDLFFGLWVLALAAYLVKETRRSILTSHFNWPKNLILIGTALSWYLGIVTFNGDLAFTATNVVAHGIPYMALVYIYREKKNKGAQKKSNWGMVIGKSLLPFVVLLFVLAYLEEGLWDALVWRDHETLFPWANQLPFIENERILAFLVPLLALPQITHYLIDGFIWRVRKPKSEAEQRVFGAKA